MANFKLRVETFLIADPDTVETSREIDHGYKMDRAWLEKHLFWAVRNDRGVEIRPIATTDSEEE